MGGVGISALHQLNGIIRERRGRELDAAFTVLMPGNFPLLSRPPKGRRRGEILMTADERLGEIAEAIGGGHTAPISRLMKALTYGMFTRGVQASGKRFSVLGACTGCGTCANVCPAGNIDIVDDRPVWARQCELCCACFHSRPAEAIQLNVLLGTEGRGRYRHPDVTVADMERQAGRNRTRRAG